MKNNLFNWSVLILAIAMFSVSCNGDDDGPEPQEKYGNVKVQFEYVFGHNEEPWDIGKVLVHPMTGDTMTFTMFKYYVSNIKLKDASGSWWSEPNSYHLVCTDCDNRGVIMINNVPEGNYTAIQYTMGVDSAMNVSGVYDGDLSLGNGMFWDWNSGFIMLKAEGKSPNSATDNFAFHLGGFKGTENIVTVKNADFGSNLSVQNGSMPSINLKANPARLWHNADGLSIVSTAHMPGQVAVDMAKAFYSNIYLSSVSN